MSKGNADALGGSGHDAQNRERPTIEGAWTVGISVFATLFNAFATYYAASHGYMIWAIASAFSCGACTISAAVAWRDRAPASPTVGRA